MGVLDIYGFEIFEVRPYSGNYLVRQLSLKFNRIVNEFIIRIYVIWLKCVKKKKQQTKNH